MPNKPEQKQEIEITDEMVKAGLLALEDSMILPDSLMGPGDGERDAVIKIFLKMLIASQTQPEIP